MPDARNLLEGTLRWVLASGQTGTAWSTASAPTSGLMGFVQAGMAFSDPRTYFTVSDRGLPSHHKLVDRPANEMTFTVLEGNTADYPVNLATATGSSVPKLHWEFKQAVPVVEGTQTGIYYRGHGAVLISHDLTEQMDANQHKFTLRQLLVSGPSNTGFLS